MKTNRRPSYSTCTPHFHLSVGVWSLMVGVFLLTGCHSVGPHTVPRDRSDYSDSISDSWKKQTLLNIVKLRYLDPPVFVDVGQIVSGYSLETTLNAGGSFPETTGLGGNTAAVGGAARFTDRPTITYTPLTGNKFIKALMTPLPPESIFFMIQSGWPADAVLFVSTAGMNSLKNQESTISGVTPPDPKFLRALELLRKIQLSAGVGMRVQRDAKKNETTLVTFRSGDLPPEIQSASKELREILRLDPEAGEFKLGFGATAANDKELALQTRSMLHIMMTVASQVEVPAEHVSQGRASPGSESASKGDDRLRFVAVHSSKQKPADVYVAVHYRGNWFYIDDRDLKSKRSFAFMMMLFTLAETGEKEPLPLITIPAQ